MAKNATTITDGTIEGATPEVSVADLVGAENMLEAENIIANGVEPGDIEAEEALDDDESPEAPAAEAPVVVEESAETKAARENYEAAMALVAAAQADLAAKMEGDFLAATQSKYDAWLEASAPTRTTHEANIAALVAAQTAVDESAAALAQWEATNPRRKQEPVAVPKTRNTSDGQSHRGETHLYEVLFSESQAGTLAANPEGLAATGFTLRGRVGYVRVKGDLRHARYNAGVATKAILGGGFSKQSNIIANADEKAEALGI